MADIKIQIPSKKRSIKFKKKKTTKPTCKNLKILFSKKTEPRQINNPNYLAHLRCMSKEDREALTRQPNLTDYLYPLLEDPHFNEKIAIKKEFNDCKYETKTKSDFQNIKEMAQQLCDNTEFELEPHQMFVRNFMSFQTPYNGLLLFHGVGTGKTCSAISVCEEMRTYLKQLGITKRIIIVASPAVQENFKIQLFDERKLKNISGLWNIKACTGNKFLKEINPMNMRGLSRRRVVRQINRIINQSYHFQGYIEFSNYINRIMQKVIRPDDDIAKQRRKIDRILRKEFSNRMLVIDEVHNLRIDEAGKIKKSSENLLSLVSAADNLKLLLLSATPMFNSHTEIIWLMNLLNLNDKRFSVHENEIFNHKGNFVVDSAGHEIGKELLIQKITGYISYVRGENPFTFPNIIYPNVASNPQSLTALLQSNGWAYPSLQLNQGQIIQPTHLLDLTIAQIGPYQEKGYQLLLKQLAQKYPSLNDPTKGLSYTVLEAPLQALNIVYPHKDLDTETDDADVYTYLYGSRGLKRIMHYNHRQKSDFKYKDSTLTDFGPIFSLEEIGKYSSKIKYICEKIKNSKGIVFVYSQYIDGGIVPLALCLEEMGFTRAGGHNLFETPPTEPIDALTMMTASKDAHIKNAAKYIMITGDKNLSPDIKHEIKSVTADDNIYGEKVKVILVSRAGSEGLDFKNIRQTHILDPWYNLNRQDQIIGRAVRNFSHCALPYEERNVEIYMYGTQLTGNRIEAADLYVYRLAERKAKKIASVSRILKENAVDCLLNRIGLDFSEHKMNKVVIQHLSSGKHINYHLGDKNNSAICDFMNCEYKCNARTEEIDEVNLTSYNETFIIMNLDKILQRIRLLYREQYIYKKRDLISAITQIKHYPLDQIYTALNYLIVERNEYLTDMLGRLGRLVNIHDYYMFQPIELKDKHITRYERVRPISFTRDKLTYTLPNNIPVISHEEVANKEVNNVMIQLQADYAFLQTPSYIKSLHKEHWAMAAGWAIRNLEIYNKIPKIDLIRLATFHMLDVLSYQHRVSLLNNIYYKHKPTELEMLIQTYFKQFIIHAHGKVGIVLSNFNKPPEKDPYTIFISKDTTWELADTTSISMFRAAVFATFQVTDLNRVSNTIGFMTVFKQHNIVFKTKELELSSKGRTNKGHRCAHGEVKSKIIKRINSLLSSSVQPIKYLAKKNTIASIYGNTNIKQYISEDGKKQEVKLNALQLCIENELILRWFDQEKKDQYIWFFSALSATINDIVHLGRKIK